MPAAAPLIDAAHRAAELTPPVEAARAAVGQAQAERDRATAELGARAVDARAGCKTLLERRRHLQRRSGSCTDGVADGRGSAARGGIRGRAGGTRAAARARAA